ncbi:MAG: YraN family protein [Halothiobacillaceae bacterium]
MSERRAKGKAGEHLALEHLEGRGLRLLARNVHAHGGEIDLVMLDGATLVFVEVRSRSAHGLVGAVESITPTKRQRLRMAAQTFLVQHPQHATRPCRFDVVGITQDGHRTTLEWVANAFEVSA